MTCLLGDSHLLLNRSEEPSALPSLPAEPFPGGGHVAKDLHMDPPIDGDGLRKFHRGESVLRIRINKGDGPDGRSDPFTGCVDHVVHLHRPKLGAGEVLLDEHLREPALGTDSAYLIQVTSHILRRVISRYDDVQ